jgi:hypothetical protein
MYLTECIRQTCARRPRRGIVGTKLGLRGLPEEAHGTMRTSTRISSAGWAVAAALVLGLSGCGSTTGSNAAAHARKTPGRQSAPAVEPAPRALDDMVAAVSASKAGPPVELKFDLRQRPEVGQPVDVDIAMVPVSAAIDHLYARFQTGDGLNLVEGGELATVEKPAQGVPIRHVVRITPRRDGIFTLSATVGVDSTNDSVSRTFSIPVIAGEGLQGLAELAPKSEVSEGQVASPKAH